MHSQKSRYTQNFQSNKTDIELNDLNGSPPPYQESSNLARAFNRDQKLIEILTKYEISNEFAVKLQQLQGFKIVFIFDDSGSMNTILQDSPLNTTNLSRVTRWDELQYFASISIEIASLFDPNGCDVYFLNRKPSPLRNINNSAELIQSFSTRPNGFTPLARILNQVLVENNQSVLNERKLLIIIATDGEPTDDNGKVNVREFKKSLLSRNDRTYTTVVVCTDDDDSIAYLDKWDKNIKFLDVVDDYRNERDQIKKRMGKKFRFSFGDYVVKSLVGSVDPELDKLDEDGCSCNLI